MCTQSSVVSAKSVLAPNSEVSFLQDFKWRPIQTQAPGMVSMVLGSFQEHSYWIIGLNTIITLSTPHHLSMVRKVMTSMTNDLDFFFNLQGDPHGPQRDHIQDSSLRIGYTRVDRL